MSFVQFVKSEIVSKPIKDLHCKRAFLLGILRGAGSIYSNDGEVGLMISVSSEEIAMLISELFLTVYGYEVREVSVEQDKLNKKDKFSLYLGGDMAVDILLDLKILKESYGELSVDFNYFNEINDKECCMHAFIRGIFLSSGTCTIPQNKNSKTSYFLSIPFSRSETASAFINKLAKFNVYAKVMRRRELFVLYIKSVEQISNFLALLPAPKSVFKLTDLVIERELINDSNRKRNCDIGNVGRQIDAIKKQVDAINKIKEKMGLEKLNGDLFIVANARLNNPDDSLIELAEGLNISKSCLNHRIRKIIEISNTL